MRFEQFVTDIQPHFNSNQWMSKFLILYTDKSGRDQMHWFQKFNRSPLTVNLVTILMGRWKQPRKHATILPYWSGPVRTTDWKTDKPLLTCGLDDLENNFPSHVSTQPRNKAIRVGTGRCCAPNMPAKSSLNPGLLLCLTFLKKWLLCSRTTGVSTWPNRFLQATARSGGCVVSPGPVGGLSLYLL